MNEGAEGVVVRPLAKRTGVKPAVVGAEGRVFKTIREGNPMDGGRSPPDHRIEVPG